MQGGHPRDSWLDCAVSITGCQHLSSCHFRPWFSKVSFESYPSKEFLLVGKMPFLKSVGQNFISCPPFRESIEPIREDKGNKLEVFRQFVESIRQNLRDKLVVVRHVIEPIRQDAGSKVVVFRQFVESTRQGLGNNARQLVASIRGSIRQGLEDNILVFNYTLLLQAIVVGLGAILSGVLCNIISNRLYDMEHKNVSGFITLVRYLPMSFVHYYYLTIPTVILWVVQYNLFMKLKVIGHLPVVARPLDSQVTRPGSHPLDAQRQDSPITGPPHPQLTGPIDPQATVPSDPQGTGPLDLRLKMLLCLLEHCGSPAPAMSVNSAIQSARWAQEGPELLALTLFIKNPAEDVGEIYQSLVAQSLVALPTGSKVLYRTFEFGPHPQDSEFEELRKLVLDTMSTARILDPDCTLQLGSFAVWKYTDSGLRWWILEKSWTPTISEVRQSPWNLLYTLSGFPRLWIVRGSNLRRATLKASTEEEIETLHVLQHKVESNEDVLLCEEPRLIQASAIREKVYICASHSVEVQDGVTFGLQSEPINANKSSWILAMGRFIRWTTTMFLSLSLLLLGGVSYGINFFIWHLVDLQHDDITVLGATLQRSSIPSYIFLLLHVLLYGVLFSYSRIFVQPSRVIVDGIPQPDEILTETSLHAHEGDDVHSPQTTSPSQEFGDAPGNSPSSTRTKSEGASGSGDLPEHGISTPGLTALGDVTRLSFVKPVSPNASSEAEEMYKHSLARFEKAVGKDHALTLETVHNLGTWYSEQGKFAEAEEMYQRALAGFEKALGKDHASTLETVNNLGNLYSRQGKFTEAEEMFKRALARLEKALEKDHASTLETVNNLGNFYSCQGKFAEAGEMYKRALAGFEKALGKDHALTLETVHNLSTWYSEQGKFAEAEEMCKRALAGEEKALGKDHTSTLETVNNLGNLYSRQGKFAKAEEMYKRALAGFEKALGKDHASILEPVNNLGNLYSRQGKFAEAEEMYKRALAGFEKALGKDDALTLETVDNLGTWYSEQGKFAEAEEMYKRALAGEEKALLKDHASTLKIVNNLGNLYSRQGKFAKAEEMYKRALAGFEKALGKDHASTLETVNNLGADNTNLIGADNYKTIHAQQQLERISHLQRTKVNTEKGFWKSLRQRLK